MPLSHRAVGLLTGAFVAVGETAVVFFVPWLHPRTADLRVLAVGWVLLSSLTGGLTALVIYRGAKGSGTWFVALRCMAVGVYLGVGTFLVLYAIAWVLAIVIFGALFAHSNIGGY